MYDAFISYSHDDKEFALDLVTQLVNEGIRTWIDAQNIPPATPWRQAIYDGILSSKYFMPVLSPNYLESPMCRMESFLAFAHRKTALPVTYKTCFKEMLQYPETRYLHRVRHLEYAQDSIHSKSMTDEERLQNILTVIRDQVPEKLVYDVYFAFPKQEYDFTLQLWETLNAQGIHAFLTTKGYIGDDWDYSHWDALRQSKVVIMVLTSDIAKSFNIQKEVLYTRTLNLPILPILAPAAAENTGHINDMRIALDAIYETRVLNELQWLNPLPDMDKMLSEMTSIVQDVIARASHDSD